MAVAYAGSEAGARWVSAALNRYEAWIIMVAEEFLRLANEDQGITDAWKSTVAKYKLSQDEMAMIWEEVVRRHTQ